MAIASPRRPKLHFKRNPKLQKFTTESKKHLTTATWERNGVNLMHHSLSTQKRSSLFFMLVVCLSQFGCSNSDDRLTTYPVSGKVLKAGAPIAYVSVVLHPTGTSDTDFAKPRAVTAADGTFELTTYDSSDGAPAGNYQVTIEQWVTEKPEEGPKNKLKSKFASPATSGITVSISSGENLLPAFTVD